MELNGLCAALCRTNGVRCLRDLCCLAFFHSFSLSRTWPAVKISSLTHVWETDLASWKKCLARQHCEDLECLAFITLQMTTYHLPLLGTAKIKKPNIRQVPESFFEKWKQIKLRARVRQEELGCLLSLRHFRFFLIMLWNVTTVRTGHIVLAHHGNTPWTTAHPA